MSIAIRALQPADIEPLVALWVAAWTPVLPAIDFAAREGFIRDRLSAYVIPPRIARVVSHAGRLAGFALADRETGELEQIAVLPAFQGQGVADGLLTAVAGEVGRPLGLSVNRDNPRAVAFYRRNGFVVTGEGFSAASGLPILFMRQEASPALGDQAENCIAASRA